MNTTTRVQTLTVASGETTSAAFVADGQSAFGLVVPSTFDGTTITFEVSLDGGDTYYGLNDTNGSPVSMTVAASEAYDLPGELTPWKLWRIVCGSAQATTATAFVVVGKA